MLSKPSVSEAPIFGLEDSWEALNAWFLDHDLTDGLPIVPPAEARVAAMTAYVECELGYRPGDVIGTLAPKHGQATLKKIAANAVMAGCKPEYLPLILCPQHARLLANGGYSKAEVKRHRWEHARISFGTIPRGNLTSFSKKLLAQTANGNPDFPVPIADKPEDIVIVVMGGTGTHSLSVQTRLASENVNVPIFRKDATLWRVNS